MSNAYTYPNPVLSLWQAAAAEVHRRHASVQKQMGLIASAQAALLDADTLMAPAASLGESLKAGKPVPPPAPRMAAHAELLGSVVVDCAKTAAQFLAAEITGNQQQSAILAGELKDSTCDIG